ncbi:hypothetical protein PYCC9005_002451 [Savitreella phatthalungensis]
MALWSLAKYTLALIYLLAWKNGLFVWHLRFGYYILKRTIQYKVRPITTRDIWEVRTVSSRASLGDLDYNLHKSNSTYFADADMARLDFALAHWDRLLLLKAEYYVALGGVAASFKRQIDPYEHYDIQTKLVAWDEKWFFLSTRFVNGKGIHKAQSVAQYVFKRGRKTIEPAEVLRLSGYVITDADRMKNEEQLKVARGLLSVGDAATLW